MMHTSSGSRQQNPTTTSTSSTGKPMPGTGGSTSKHGIYDSLGSLRFLADKREFAGLLLLIAFCTMMQPMYRLAITMGTNGTTTKYGTPFAVLFGDIWLLTSGILCLMTAYHALVHGLGSKMFTTFLIAFVQISYIAYIAEMVSTGQGIHGYASGTHIPAGYDAGIGSFRYCGAMGIMGIMAYSVALLGSLTFFLLALLAFQNKVPYQQNVALYKGYFGLFSFVLFFAGLSQFLLGCYLAARFGRLNNGPVFAGVYLVSRPGIAVVVGAFQLVGGLAGMTHAYGIRTNWSDESRSFLYYMGLTWLLQVVLQALTQPAFAAGNIGGGFAPDILPFTIPLNLMPVYLQFKSVEVDEDIGPAWYGLGSHHGGTSGHGMGGEAEETEAEHHDEPGASYTGTGGTTEGMHSGV